MSNKFVGFECNDTNNVCTLVYYFFTAVSQHTGCLFGSVLLGWIICYGSVTAVVVEQIIISELIDSRNLDHVQEILLIFVILYFYAIFENSCDGRKLYVI